MDAIRCIRTITYKLASGKNKANEKCDNNKNTTEKQKSLKSDKNEMYTPINMK